VLHQCKHGLPESAGVIEIVVYYNLYGGRALSVRACSKHSSFNESVSMRDYILYILSHFYPFPVTAGACTLKPFTAVIYGFS
jgi:hypothetical protein